MQKKSTKQTTKKITPMARIEKPAKVRTTGNWSASIYIYWFIILFFIAATFYILGRAHTSYAPNTNSDAPAEEQLLQASDYYESGKTKLISGDIDGAIADLTTAIESGDANSYIMRGEAYMAAGDYASALADLNTVINSDSTNAIAYYDRGLLNIRLEDYQSALNDINNALAITASSETPSLQQRDLYAKRGQINLWLKNWEGAIADYTNSLARPDGIVSPDIYAERAEAYTAIGNYNAAIDDYASAVRVISEQIQIVTTDEERLQLSTNAMDYFEKSAALNLSAGNTDAAKTDLSSAMIIAKSINHVDRVEHLQSLLNQLN